MCGEIEFRSNTPYATNSYIRLGKKFGNFIIIDMFKTVPAELLDKFKGMIMLKRLAEPEEIANAIIFYLLMKLHTLQVPQSLWMVG